MNTKRIVLILIAIAFLLIAVFSLVGLFAIKKVEVDFAVSEDREVESIQTLLDGYNGKNLMFLNIDDVKDTLKGYHYLEVLSVDKQYPNVLKVSLKERREVYYVDFDGKTFVMNENGFVLAQKDYVESRNVIKLTLGDGVSITEIKEGSVIKTDNDALLSAVFSMAKSVNLTDCIKSISVKKIDGYDTVYDTVFNSFTGVEICVEDTLVNGAEKVSKAFTVYDEYLTDYQKTYGAIQAYLQQDGQYKVTYNQEFIDIT